ncbi:HAD-IA family hydrolase [Bacillus mangrovi]|uniref:HAD-IA family hydrolase n=1 Tax=Metabacillus mangrovi TaxID=1491830 RepID=A0A7X2V266_9BACI|nr:HAD family hydrolase [Metabacillus mangrovi]MTH51867.1 HAD-IA family hydrolase [Metabacillus mangrovi]
MLFDLDDTLVDRDRAVERMFCKVIETCYEDVPVNAEMLQAFKENDQKDYGTNDKTQMFESFFHKYPPAYRLQGGQILEFWNVNFPLCFEEDPEVIQVVEAIRRKGIKTGIITNGSSVRQRAKLKNTRLNPYFETILISEEAGLSKPDSRIFELALYKLNVQPEDTLFIGDNLHWDIEGCQNACMMGVWYNPLNRKAPSDIIPFAEISSLDQLLDL